MPKLAQGRTEYLTPAEIATAALRQFDVNERPLSMRALAGSLGVSAASIYHHFPNEESVIRAAVSLVFDESFSDFLTTVGDPLTDEIDPETLLIGGALALRRGFLRHHRIAPYIATSPESSSVLAGLLALLGAAFEQMGVTGERAGEAVWAYGHFVYGSILLTASTRLTDERFGAREPVFSTAYLRDQNAPPTAAETTEALERAVSASGSSDDERYFVAGLRMLIDGCRRDAEQARGAPASPASRPRRARPLKVT